MAKQADLFPTTSTPFALPEAERERIENEIEEHLSAAERLIHRLDDIDGDPDFCGSEHDGIEPDTDEEPSLGWTGDTNQIRALKSCRDGGEDMEAEHDGREPSLGWTVSGTWGGTCDREQDCEDEGACETALDVL